MDYYRFTLIFSLQVTIQSDVKTSIARVNMHIYLASNCSLKYLLTLTMNIQKLFEYYMHLLFLEVVVSRLHINCFS